MTASIPSALLSIVPIFALILAGLLTGRAKLLGPHAGDGLNGFVIWLALPALLFATVAKANWADLWQPGFIAVFGISGLAMLMLAVLVAVFKGRRNLADAAIAGLNAGYSNVGFMGFPIAATLLGTSALLPTTIAAVMTMCVFFAGTIVLVEIGLHAGGSVGHVLYRVAKSLVRHPLVIAPVCGIPFALFAIGIPAPASQFLNMLAGAASPCALVAIGLFLAKKQLPSEQHGMTMLPFLVLCKLLVQPLLAWFLAAKIFHLDPVWLRTAVLMAALPTGTGAFMLAEHYRRDATISSRVIVISTLLSIITISLGMAVLL